MYINIFLCYNMLILIVCVKTELYLQACNHLRSKDVRNNVVYDFTYGSEEAKNIIA